MNLQTLFPVCLTLHLTALTLLAGTTVVDFITFRSFWKFYTTEREKALGILAARANFSRLLGIGAAFLIITGIGMMALTHGVFGEQLWFRIKIVLVVLLILNSVLFGRRNNLKLNKLVVEQGAGDTIMGVKTTLQRFYAAQLTLLFLIIFLSAFKFN